jgi:hypothetical protein
MPRFRLYLVLVVVHKELSRLDQLLCSAWQAGKSSDTTETETRPPFALSLSAAVPSTECSTSGLDIKQDPLMSLPRADGSKAARVHNSAHTMFTLLDVIGPEEVERKRKVCFVFCGEK